MAVSFSRPDPSSPAAVASAAFPTVRRGFDPNEVRDFLRMVAAELSRLQERERYLELWLEGQRLADERRWAATNTPGSNDTPNFEALSPLFSQNPRSYCFDIPNNERDLNPNVPSVGG